MKQNKKMVTSRALIQRINRKLAQQGPMGELIRSDRKGGYMHIDLKSNSVIELDVSIPALAKELKVLEPWEVAE